MSVSFGSLSMVPWILYAQASWGVSIMPPAVAAPERQAEARLVIRDRGGLFGGAAARETSGGIGAGHRARIQIETVASLDGSWIGDEARRRAEMVEADRLYILVVGDEQEVGVIGARRGLAARLTDEQRAGIRHAFLEPLRAGDPAGALDQGLRAIAATFDEAAANPRPETRWVMLFAATVLSILFVSWLRERVQDWKARRRVFSDVANDDDDALILGSTPRGESAPDRVGSGRVPARCRGGARTGDANWQASRRGGRTTARRPREILESER